MKLIRVGDKLISWDKISASLAEILRRRSKGATQQEVAAAFGIERTFVSYLEGMGSIRKGRRAALIGFPISNRDEVRRVAQECGVEYIRLLSEKQREEFVSGKGGSELLSETLELLAELKDFDLVVVVASDKQVAMIEKILDKEVASLPIGSSPMTKDHQVDTDELRRLLEALVENHGEENIASDSQRQPWLFKKRPRSRSRIARGKI